MIMIIFFLVVLQCAHRRFANVAFNAIRPIVISQDNIQTGEKDEVKPPEIFRIEKVLDACL